MVTLDEIRKKIVEAIRASGLTQKALAEKIGVRQPTVRQYIAGRALPALDTFSKLCTVLGLDANEILCVTK